MKPLDVRIEEVKPTRFASVRVISANPETDAWRKIKTWAQSKGLLRDNESHAVFGYTFQPPRKGQDEYGYEFWMFVGPEVEIEGEVTQQEFGGGFYAVVRHDGPPSPDVWKGLWDWVQASPYKWRKTHELERPRNPLAPEQDWVFDLYLPVESAD